MNSDSEVSLDKTFEKYGKLLPHQDQYIILKKYCANLSSCVQTTLRNSLIDDVKAWFGRANELRVKRAEAVSNDPVEISKKEAFRQRLEAVKNGNVVPMFEYCIHEVPFGDVEVLHDPELAPFFKGGMFIHKSFPERGTRVPMVFKVLKQMLGCFHPTVVDNFKDRHSILYLGPAHNKNLSLINTQGFVSSDILLCILPVISDEETLKTTTVHEMVHLLFCHSEIGPLVYPEQQDDLNEVNEGFIKAYSMIPDHPDTFARYNQSYYMRNWIEFAAGCVVVMILGRVSNIGNDVWFSRSEIRRTHIYQFALRKIMSKQVLTATDDSPLL